MDRPLELSMDELAKLPTITLACTLVRPCAHQLITSIYAVPEARLPFGSYLESPQPVPHCLPSSSGRQQMSSGRQQMSSGRQHTSTLVTYRAAFPGKLQLMPASMGRKLSPELM